MGAIGLCHTTSQYPLQKITVPLCSLYVQTTPQSKQTLC